MYITSHILTVASLTAVLLTLAGAYSSIGQDTEFSLMNFMARSNDLLQQNPARSLDCFNYYIPLINQIAKDYETNFGACQNESLAARSKADEATDGDRKDLANAAQNSCELLSQCSDGDSVETIFECYIDGGANNIKTMYGINANASQQLAELREQYYLIVVDEYKCTNETKRIYEQKSAAAYDSLNSCILGTSEVPTNPPPTAAPEQPTTKPQPPEQTTAAPEQPTTASQPEQSTAERPVEPAEPEATTAAAESTGESGEVSPNEPSTEEPNRVAPENSENSDY